MAIQDFGNVDAGWWGQNMTKKKHWKQVQFRLSQEQGYLFQRGSGDGGQETRDPGLRWWRLAEVCPIEIVCTGCKKLEVTKGNHGSAFTPAELRYCSCFMYLVLIYSTSSKSIKLGLECEASTKAPQKLNKYEAHRNPENAKTGVLSRQETYETEPLWIFDRTKLKNIIFFPWR